MVEKTDNPFEEFVTEAFTSRKTASSWESNMIRWPHGATTNSGTYERNFLNRAKEEEENAKAPPIKPYPLDHATDCIVKLYDELCTLKKTLVATKKYPNISNEEIQILRQEIKNIKLMIDKLKDMFYNIEKITL